LAFLDLMAATAASISFAVALARSRAAEMGTWSLMMQDVEQI